MYGASDRKKIIMSRNICQKENLSNTIIKCFREKEKNGY